MPSQSRRLYRGAQECAAQSAAQRAWVVATGGQPFARTYLYKLQHGTSTLHRLFFNVGSCKSEDQSRYRGREWVLESVMLRVAPVI